MSATDEELEYVKENEMDHVTYILIVLRQVSYFSSLNLSTSHVPLVLHSSFTHSLSSSSICTLQQDEMPPHPA